MDNSSQNSPFHPSFFVDNLQPSGAIEDIKKILDNPNPCLVNIHPGDLAGVDPGNPYSEQARKGGLGKSFAMREARLHAYQIHFAPATPGRDQTNDRANAKAKLPFIELSSQYTTKKDILCEIVKRMDLIDESVTKIMFGQVIASGGEEEIPGESFLDVFPLQPPKDEQAVVGDYDPSFRAERLFDQSVRQYLEQHKNAALSGKFLFFFDGFDEQYLGSEAAPLRTWLVDLLFPWLVVKMQSTVFVAGREKLKVSQSESLQVQYFQLAPFNEEKVYQYFKIKLSPGEHKKQQQQVLKELRSTAKGGYTDLCREIQQLTEGKPIFIDFLCTLVNRVCIELEEKSLGELLGQALGKTRWAASEEKKAEQKQLFKQFLIGRIHLRDTANDENRNQCAAAITRLALVKHGLNPKQYAEFWYGGEAGQQFEGEVRRFFQEVFTEEKLSAIVKDRDNGEEIVRLLHDEVLELVLEYHHNLSDPHFEKRNELTRCLLNMWERDILKKRSHPDFPKRLLEYVEYSFNIYGKEDEEQAINRFLFEFAYHLDRHPDLCSRLLEKAYKYYWLKHEKCLLAQEPEGEKTTLTLSRDFFLLSKLRMREAEYCLTERGQKGWYTRVEKVMNDIQAFAKRSDFPADQKWLEQMEKAAAAAALKSGNENNLPAALRNKFSTVTQQAQSKLLKALKNLRNQHPEELSEQEEIAIENWLCAKRVVLSDHQREGLEARWLSSTGEMKFWRQDWEKGKEDIQESKRLFYLTGDSHGVIWTEHLLGFEAQRNGRFLEAARHHNIAIEASIDHFRRLAEEIKLHGETHKNIPFVLLYRLLFLVRTIDRAGSNLGVNLRYRGKLVDAIKVLSSTIEMAQLAGLREEIRVQSNALQFKAVIGNLSQDAQAESNTSAPILESIYNELNALLINVLKVNDPLLPKRLSNTRVIIQLKSTGSERNIYIATTAEPLVPLEDSEAKKTTAKALATLEKDIPSKPIFLSISHEQAPAFDILSRADEADFRKKFNVNFGREIADMYYQYGKMTLATLTTNKPKDAFYVACQAFENARFIAQEASFLYLEMEACEALFRLSYLSKDHRKRKEEFKGLFNKAAGQIKDFSESDIGVYHDLWAKYYVTEGDFALEEALKPDYPPAEAFEEPFKFYALALRHAHLHNQSRFLLLLQVLENRVHQVFRLARRHGEREALSRVLNETIRSSKIFKEDRTFPIFLESFLEAATLQADPEQQVSEHHLKTLRDDVWTLMGKGKFIKAAAINNCLIQYYEALSKTNPASKLDLAYRHFQTFYCYQGANLNKKASAFLDSLLSKYPGISPHLENTLKVEIKPFSNFEEAIIAVAYGTKRYLTGDFWTLEKFIYGELQAFREGLNEGQLKQLDRAESLLHSAILTFLDEKKIKKTNEKLTAGQQVQERKRRERMLSEALFRLGELYILKHTGQPANEQKQKADEIAGQLFQSEILKEFQHQIENKNFWDTPALLVLNCAYLLAKKAGESDRFRKEDALQSIANARYLGGETCEEETSLEAERNRNIDNIIEHIHLRIKQHTIIGKDNDKYTYPIVVSKAALVEGDIYFSLLFKHTGADAYELRAAWKTALNEENILRKVEMTGHLHRMMWNYLFGLNQISDKGKPYENYHFHNIMFEINRRILLIKEKRLVRMLSDDLKPIWNSFPSLAGKPELLQSLQFDIAIHEMALSANETLHKYILSPEIK
ncbi:MAG: hypothetical protein AAB316_03315 [Bacteroidota bacterium]